MAFLAAFGVQYGLYHRLLRKPLRSQDVEQTRPAFMRWITIAIIWQGVVLLGCWIYVLVFARHAAGIAWASPAVGAAFGTALPLQLVVFAALRSARSNL